MDFRFIVVVFLWIARDQVFGAACPALCSCNVTREGIIVACSQRNLQRMPSPLPDSTTRLILANNTLQSVPWNELAVLKKLSYIDLRDNPMNCRCDYLEFWHQNVKPDAARDITVEGSCILPNGASSSFKRIDTRAFDYCDSTVSPTPTKISAVTTSAQQIRPTATVKVVASSSVAMPTRPPPDIPEIKHFNGNHHQVSVGTVVRITCRAVGSPRPEVTLFLRGPSRSISDWEKGKTASGYGEIDATFQADGNSEVRCVAKNINGEVQQKGRIVVEQTGVKYMMLKLVEEDFSDSVLDKMSAEFRDLAKRIREAVASVLRPLPGFISATLVNTRPGLVGAEILIKTVNTSQEEVDDLLSKDLAQLGSLKVDRYKYSLTKLENSKPCAAEFLNITWSETLELETTYHKCPHNAKGIAKRSCLSNGVWYYPDYTECKTDPFDQLKEKMLTSVSQTAQIQQNEVEKQMLSVLRDLLNLTSHQRDEARLAGDLITSTDIVELLVNYTAKQRDNVAYSQEEVKTTLHLASCLLHFDNEQEFIMAQKVTQAASRLIRYLEIYGMQAVPLVGNTGGHLIPYIYENIVMGTGIARPENISHDVVFPDYDRPDLAAVRQKWQASSLVVVDEEVIRSLENETKEIKMSGFIYRTLTRIFSAESAYSEVGLNFDVNSAVVSATMDPKPKKFIKPIVIAADYLNDINLNGTPPICAYWDFKINAPHGGWSEEGCHISTYNIRKTVCRCNHMTNFGVLTVKPVVIAPAKSVYRTYCAFCSCLFMALWIMIAWCALTLLVLLIFFTCLKPDRTWAMHMCVCASLIVAFALLLVGLDSYNNLAFCNLLSFLTHYFFLSSFSWILTEGVYMLTWGTASGPKKYYWIGYFLLGWGLPGIPMSVTWVINGLTGFESPFSCWMTIFSPLMWVFFGSALAITLLCFIIYQRVWKMATGPQKIPLKEAFWKTRFRVHVVYCLVLLFMFLGVWLLGVLLLFYVSRGLLCIVFTIWCFITGFLVFWFYCVMDRQVRDALRSCCCYFRRGRRGRYYPRDDGNITPDEMAEGQRTSLLVHGSGSLFGSDTLKSSSLEWENEVKEPLITPGELGMDEEIPFNDPLYQHITRTKMQIALEKSTDVKKETQEPIYAEVHKPKNQGASEGDIPSTSTSLTRETVIEMAKKSDASKKQLQRYKSLGSDDQLDDKYRSSYVINQNNLDTELAHFNGRQPLDTSTPVRSEVHVTNVYQTYVTVTKGPERPLTVKPVEVRITPSPQKSEKRVPLTPTFSYEKEYESQTINVSFEKPPSEDYMPIVEITLKPMHPEKNSLAPVCDMNGDTLIDELEMRTFTAHKDGHDSSSRPTSV